MMIYILYLMFYILHFEFLSKSKVQTSVLGLGVDFLLPLSQEQEQEQEEQEPLTKIYQKGVY